MKFTLEYFFFFGKSDLKNECFLNGREKIIILFFSITREKEIMELVSNTGETTFSLFPRSSNILEVVTILQKRDARPIIDRVSFRMFYFTCNMNRRSDTINVTKKQLIWLRRLLNFQILQSHLLLLQMEVCFQIQNYQKTFHHHC